MTLNNLISELLRFQMMTSRKSEYVKKADLRKKTVYKSLLVKE